MRFPRLRVRNVAPFEEIDIDVDAIPGLLVAVVGPNGAGKTRFLNLLTGALCYRECENSGPLLGLSTARDSFVEGPVVINGHNWTIRHEFDGVNGKQESFVTDASGAPVLESCKVSSFDEWAKKTFPAPEVLYASTIVPQKSKGFLEMKPAERLAILLRAIGAEKLEGQASDARKLAEQASKRIDVTKARLGDERARALDPKAAAEMVANVHLEVGVAEHDARVCAEHLELLREQAVQIGRHNAEQERRAQELAAAQEAVRAAERPVEDLAMRIRNNRELLARKGEVEAAVAKAKVLDDSIVAVRASLSTHECAKGPALIRQRDQHQRAVSAGLRIASANNRASDARAQLARREEIDKAIADVEQFRGREAEAEETLAQARATLDSLNGKRLASVEDRVTVLRQGLQKIVTDCSDDAIAPIAVTIAKTTLKCDDEQVQAARELPGAVRRAKEWIAQAEKALVDARARRQRIESVAALAPMLERAQQDLARAQQDLATAEAETKTAEQELAVATQVAADAVRAANADRTTLEELLAARAEPQLATWLAVAPKLTDAEARLEELSAQRAFADATLAQARLRLIAAAPPADLLAPPDVAGMEATVRGADKALAETRTRAALAERQLEEAKKSADKIAELEASLAQDRESHADWTRSASDLEGIKLMEVDAAGPALTEEANKLLHGCHGPRFTVTIDTQRLHSNGKKMIDGVDIRVMDADPKRPRDGAGESFSPGEQTIVNEAISLSLAILYCGKASVSDVTLVRDETGSQLDCEGSAAAYIAMLRQAASKIGASKVLFVSHSREVWELADARIEVRDGKLTVKT